MKINLTQNQTFKPARTSEAISQKTIEEFPGLPDKFLEYSGHCTVCPTGFEIPVKDSVYIGRRSK